jgi:hypothetical protein
MDDDLAGEDLARIQSELRAKGAVPRPCPMCDQQVGWQIRGAERVALPGAIPGTPFLLRCVLLICTNCGFVRLHDSEVLLADVEQGGQQRLEDSDN